MITARLYDYRIAVPRCRKWMQECTAGVKNSANQFDKGLPHSATPDTEYYSSPERSGAGVICRGPDQPEVLQGPDSFFAAIAIPDSTVAEVVE
jgi:hypothetical protein